jgi:twinkle protein
MADADKGAAALDEMAKQLPMLIDPSDQVEEMSDLWQKGLPPGDSTGWPSLDAHYTIVPGQFTVLTGWPGAGKSEFLDAVLVNLARQKWKFVIFSAENLPISLHISKLLEKVIGQPFGKGPTERMTEEQVIDYTNKLSKAFRFIHAPMGGVSAAMILETAQQYLDTFPTGTKKGVVIDPWNELEHWRTPGLSETEYVSQTLSLVRNWARDNATHVFIVAHPQKMRREEGKLPITRPDMISGSQHWWNKSDCAISVYRDPENPDGQEVDIYVQKVRFKNVGRPGLVTLLYDRITGKYREPVNLRSVEPVRQWVDV